MSTTFLVNILVRFILRSHRAKKLPYVYLANDLIQKSFIKHKKKDSAPEATPAETSGAEEQ